MPRQRWGFTVYGSPVVICPSARRPFASFRFAWGTKRISVAVTVAAAASQFIENRLRTMPEEITL